MYVKRSTSTWKTWNTATDNTPDGTRHNSQHASDRGPNRKLAGDMKKKASQSQTAKACQKMNQIGDRQRSNEAGEREEGKCSPSAEEVRGPSQGWSSRRGGFCVAHLWVGPRVGSSQADHQSPDPDDGGGSLVPAAKWRALSHGGVTKRDAEPVQD